MNKLVILKKKYTQKLPETIVSGIGQSYYTTSSLPTYFAARYLDPRTSRWLSVDPALGEYIPSPGQGADRLPGLGGIYNYVNMHVYHYSANNPIRYRDPDGRLTESEIENALNSVLAASPNATTTNLSVLVNTDNLANIVKRYYRNLDQTTRRFISRRNASDIKSDLDSITVIMGVNRDATLSMLDQLGIPYGDTPEAISVGNTILVFNIMRTSSNGRIIRQGDADLLGHEAIHSLQALAAGGIANAANNYRDISDNALNTGLDPYYGNIKEITAYNFGPWNDDAIRAGSLRRPIFSRHRDWHL